MENSKRNTTPMNITQLKEGEIYFTVGIGRGNFMYMDVPWRFSEVFTEFEDGMLTKKIRVTQVGPRKPIGLIGFNEDRDWLFAESYGLLAGTEYPLEYGDNHHRTFPYSPMLYEFFKDIVDKKDFAAYESIVGKRESMSAAQQVKHILFDAELRALEASMEFEDHNGMRHNGQRGVNY